MAITSPIIKRVQSYKFELIDFYEIYSHVPVMGRGGKAIIESVNRLDSTIAIRSVNNPKNVFTTDVRHTKLMLRSLDYFRSKDARLICKMAIDDEGFDANISRSGNVVICSDEEGREVIIDLVDKNMAISVTKKGETFQVKNLPFIISYMIKNGFDMYGLAQRGWAISVNSIDVSRGF